MEEKQELSDIPETPLEAERQKGPIPAAAVLLVMGLVAAFVLFFLPALLGKA